MKQYTNKKIMQMANNCHGVTEDNGLSGFKYGFKKAMELYRKYDSINPEKIKVIVELVSGIEDISVVNRSRYVIDVRSCYYALCKIFHRKFTLASCGAVVGKDHTSVLHHLNNFENLYNKFNGDGTPVFLANEVFDQCEEEIQDNIDLSGNNKFYIGGLKSDTLFKKGHESIAVFNKKNMANKVCNYLNNISILS